MNRLKFSHADEQRSKKTHGLTCSTSPMPDFLLKDIDSEVAERIKRISRERGWPINDVFHHLIKQALGMEPPPPPLPGDIAKLGGTWEDDESRAFKAALEAFKQLPNDRF
jgi:hypothetical protein